MMKTILLSLLFLSAFQKIQAQNYCKKTSLYFDLNKADLKPESLAKIDSLSNTFTGSEFLVELYGYSDSTASADYNLQLSQRRINSVKNYITSKNKMAFQFVERNLGEEQKYAKVKDLELFRRVDVYVFPLTNNKLTISSGKESVEVASDFFEPCGVCQSKPKIKSYYTEAEANQAGIQFITNTGEALESAGTFDFDYEPCDGNKKKNINQVVCYEIRAAKIDPEMTLWDADTINGQIVWKESKAKPEFDTVNLMYRFCSGPGKINLDKPKKGKNQLYFFPIEFDSIKSDFYSGEKQRNIKTHLDTFSIDSTSLLTSVGYLNGKIYYLSTDLRSIKASKTYISGLGTRQVTKVTEHHIEFKKYTEFTYGEELLKLKFKNKPDQIGFYLKEVYEFIPIPMNPKDKFTKTQKPSGNFELAYLKKGKLYVIPNKKIKLKYKKKQNLYKLKYNSKNIRLFRREKAYPVKQKEWEEYWKKAKK